MTLWDLAAQWIKNRWHSRRRRHPWMTQWPYWSKPSRFNIIQRYLIRRGLMVVIFVMIFRVNPLHPLPIALTILGLTAVMTEHRVHQEQHRLLFNIKKKRWWQ